MSIQLRAEGEVIGVMSNLGFTGVGLIQVDRCLIYLPGVTLADLMDMEVSIIQDDRVIFDRCLLASYDAGFWYEPGGNFLFEHVLFEHVLY